MAKDLLFEIGAEEIPAGFLPNIIKQLGELATAALAERHIPHGAVKVYATPRRVALLINDVAERGEDVHETHKGPSVSIAYDADGNATKAAIGFARGKGLDVSELKVVDGYIFADTTTAGLDTKEVLSDVLPSLITGLSFPKSMHWGDLEERFVRPVRWLVALFGQDVVPVTFANVTSSNVSRGHRFLGESELTITEPKDYVDTLTKNFIMIDQDVRRETIRKQLTELAATKGATVVWDEDLLDEVTFLVEYPTALCGTFDESYLALPSDCIITPMKDHQRYFPMVDGKGTLLPMFLTVRNGDSKSLEVVAAGNERVLRARLDDAKFFFNEDRKTPLAGRYEALTKIVFQEGLGNLKDKTERLLTLGAALAQEVGFTDTVTLERATHLAKTDLTTGMVSEFTELQGIMGKEYALLDGETPAVGEAIFEQYLPRFAGDILPSTDAGRILSIVDKVDTIVATFSRGLIPTGSQDPYALRRQTIGIINILMDSKWSLSMRPIWVKAMELLGVASEKQEELLGQLENFFILRLKNILLEQGMPYQVVDIVLSQETVTVALAEGLGQALTANRIDENEPLMQAYTRIFNMVKDVTFTGVDESLLKEDSEQALYKAALPVYTTNRNALEAGDYVKAVSLAESLVPYIETFFEHVMVMDKDEAVKQNRLQLLRMTYEVSNLGKLK
ncbi:glycine--tRNA ligase subunit beta [Veillonella sp. CNR 79/14]|uniref:glycine--tRNA ligase subunit beta n=1 Tax=Veillonella sp. CNR 79/14 TaxID=2490954 RepID=UPI000F8F3606|nr:glycine--tRNA ligase subunit beta [Veillonella sp. CNR 79/14]